ncbi:UNVERIFIED_CONTAM: hypothetical protein H355_007758 [Colinus virginianus]|nr:hypothetical protein H355_007758 [Colinus virginianus]
MLRIIDACSAGSASSISRMHLWRLLSLDTLNEYLERDPAPSKLTCKVPTRHRAFLFPSDQKMDMEHWAEDADLSPQELHQMRIQDNQLFSISPKAGKLLPGQEEAVQLSHRHDFIGTDHLPVLLKVSYGHEILLNFRGVTVEREQRYVHFASSKHLFMPIAVGTSHPPIQVSILGSKTSSITMLNLIYELYNGGSVPVMFEVQLDSIERVQKDNYQHPVFLCLTPRGEIAPGTTGRIEWIFSPLEARTYLVDVPIHILGGDSVLITFQGEGYDLKATEESATFREVLSPSVLLGSTRLTVPGQAASLSHHRICIGNIPDCTRVSRLVFLNNISESKATVFTWRTGNVKDSEVLQIAPEQGVVQPRGSTPCFITLQPSGNVSFYSIDLVCEVYTQESLIQYERDMQEWEMEKERQAVEFTITEQDLRAEKKPRPPAGSSSDFAETEDLCEPSVVVRKYKTLPPIKNHPVTKLPAGHSCRRLLSDKEASHVWVKPEPPRPILLHLDVTARSHSTEDFFSNFSSEFHKYFLPCPVTHQMLFVDGSVDRDRMERDPKWLSLATASKEELQIVTDVLTGVIRGLLENTQFHNAVRRSLQEPIPYFSQFQHEKSAKTQQCSTVPSRLSAYPDLFTKEDGEGKEMRQESSPSNDFLGSWEGLSEIFHHEQLREQKTMMKRHPTFRNLVEMVLENTLQNILVEASCGEVVLTARPRVIALPPSPFRRITSPAP